MSVYHDGREYVEAPWKTCEICGSRFQVGGRWHNHFLCSPGCCEARRIERNPPPSPDDYECGEDFFNEYESWRRRLCLY